MDCYRSGLLACIPRLLLLRAVASSTSSYAASAHRNPESNRQPDGRLRKFNLAEHAPIIGALEPEPARRRRQSTADEGWLIVRKTEAVLPRPADGRESIDEVFAKEQLARNQAP